jgi:hypothetical protein
MPFSTFHHELGSGPAEEVSSIPLLRRDNLDRRLVPDFAALLDHQVGGAELLVKLEQHFYQWV